LGVGIWVFGSADIQGYTWKALWQWTFRGKLGKHFGSGHSGVHLGSTLAVDIQGYTWEALWQWRVPRPGPRWQWTRHLCLWVCGLGVKLIRVSGLRLWGLSLLGFQVLLVGFWVKGFLG
jgi:hypothetical protein